jgi:hypothetical protein
VIFPVWERDVPFTVENRSVTRADGSPAVAAVREFQLSGGPRRMVDEIGVSSGALDDRLGRPVRAVALFGARILEGALHLRSERVTIVVGRLGVRLPRAVAPLIVLTERFDEAENRQRVAITVTMPIVGRVYQYAGWFRYEVDTGESR